MRIKLYASDQQQAENGFRAAFHRIAQLDDELSDYKPDSELNRAVRTAVRQPVHVSDDLFRVLEKAQKVADETNGAFDVTVGPVTHLWRESRKKGNVPDPAALSEALLRCGFRKLHLDAPSHSVSLDMPGMQLDLGGIAKGYAADEALQILAGLGIHSALVAASGDLTFSDAPPGEPGWKVGIDSLDEAGQPFTRVLLLANGAVSTSGDTEQYLDAAGKRYSHIVDPRTGLGLTNHLTVSVVARRGIDADANATAVSVLGTDMGMRYIEAHSDLAALLVSKNAGRTATMESSRFRQLKTPNQTGATH